MNKILLNYQRFFEDQIREQDNEYKAIANSPICNVFQENRFFFGIVYSVDKETGLVTLKVPYGHAPRLRINMDLCIIRKDAFADLGNHIESWSILLKEFVNESRYHTPFVDSKPLSYVKRFDKDNLYLRCEGYLGLHIHNGSQSY